MTQKITLATLKKHKQQGQPIAMLTCYDYSTAVLLEQAGADSILVGDSLAQVVLGHKNTLSVTMDTMIALTAAVRRGAPNVFLVGDMPFLSYQVSKEQAVTNAGRFLSDAGCDAVKLEVDHRHLDVIEHISRAGIPVMAHLGYRPQAARQETKIVQTRSVQRACQLVQDCLDMIDAGASTILLECVTASAARAVAERTDLPVISCGSGPFCDGQVLVLHEVLSLPGAVGPQFAQSFGQIGSNIRDAASQYVQAVHQKHFPDDQHSYHMDNQNQQEFRKWLQAFDRTKSL